MFLKKINRSAQLRGRSTPVFPVRLRRWRARWFTGGLPIANQGKKEKPAAVLRGVFVAAQKFVSFNLGHHADAAWLVDFGAPDAAEAADLYGAGKGNLVGEGQ
jgi:hypothetical protein